MMEFIGLYIATFLSSIGILYFYSQLLNKKERISVKIIIFFIICILATTFIKYKNYIFLSVASYFVFHPILFYIFSKDNLKRVFYYSAIMWIYGALFDFLTMLIISFANCFLNFNVYNIWFKVITTFLFMIFFIVSAHLPFLKKFTNKTINLLCNIKYFDILLIAFFIFTFIGGAAIVISVESLNLIFLIIMLFILMSILFILVIHCKNMDYEFSILVKNLQINNKFYTNINDEYSVFKHNLTAKLLSVESVSNKKSRVLINELIKDFNNGNDYQRLILDLPYGLDGVINQKLSNYRFKLELKIYNNLEHNIFDVISPKRYNVLVEKLSVLIDNAITASLDSSEKILIINLIEEDDSIKIEIKNTFGGKIDLDSIGKIHYSTKGKNHGFGLYSLLRNNEVAVNVKIINEYFVGKIIAKYNC